jgi:hypothetical protein
MVVETEEIRPGPRHAGSLTPTEGIADPCGVNEDHREAEGIGVLGANRSLLELDTDLSRRPVRHVRCAKREGHGLAIEDQVLGDYLMTLTRAAQCENSEATEDAESLEDTTGTHVIGLTPELSRGAARAELWPR